MNRNDTTKRKDVKHKKKEVLLNVALTLNKELFDEHIISYKMFQYTEENILKELKDDTL